MPALLPGQRYYTMEILRRYDGSDPSLPIYVSIMGRIYDVSHDRDKYGPGGDSHFYAGRDATKSLSSGCLREGCPEGWEGLSTEELQKAEETIKAFDNREEYPLVGYLVV